MQALQSHTERLDSEKKCVKKVSEQEREVGEQLVLPINDRSPSNTPHILYPSPEPKKDWCSVCVCTFVLVRVSTSHWEYLNFPRVLEQFKLATLEVVSKLSPISFPLQFQKSKPRKQLN